MSLGYLSSELVELSLSS
ncbi:hypothetical protein F383_05044 [Gossypium arboreum]|uniref:Uncharacterized protein n=1 Tax=Gossypium arboreum TaxID=29729 RepID=A0A0B0MBT3_GOSAR|nr:hypothetical protein F383_38512 [Gossypium arboreum]KHG14259.1 hypothetical protein F383_17550 [Gossypium arboreum]KHG22051.1 hypothetical protein F383_05044 [Gossypium arboreum]